MQASRTTMPRPHLNAVILQDLYRNWTTSYESKVKFRRSKHLRPLDRFCCHARRSLYRAGQQRNSRRNKRNSLYWQFSCKKGEAESNSRGETLTHRTHRSRLIEQRLAKKVTCHQWTHCSPTWNAQRLAGRADSDPASLVWSACLPVSRSSAFTTSARSR